MTDHHHTIKKYIKSKVQTVKYKQSSTKGNATPTPIHGKTVVNKEGWIQIEIWGDAFNRGYAHGFLLYKELKRTRHSFPFLIHQTFHISFKKYLQICKTNITPVIKKYYPEFYKEIEGISSGAKQKGIYLTTDELISWNSFSSMFEYFENSQREKEREKEREKQKTPQHCSAFIATGEGITEDGKIVMAHNTHSDFISGSFFNVIIKIQPEEGTAFIMQTSAGFIASVSDWFICANGIMGCETTISDVNYKVVFNKTHHPFFCRIRKAMQYGNTLDDYVNTMITNNAGDYPCSWLFGNAHTNEIMLLELGLHYYNVERTFAGIFYGMNSVFDTDIQLLETDDTDLLDIETSSGSRNLRLNSLLTNKYIGKINEKNAKIILADHYDVYENKQIMNANGICSHLYMDDTDYSNFPHGTVDGKVTNTNMALQMKFYGRWGASCGYAFNVNKYIAHNPMYKHWKTHLVSFPSYKWIVL